MSAPAPHAPGLHLILDFHGCDRLDDPAHVDAALTAAAQAAGATVLARHFHHFGAGHGVTGVLLLAESHISIHTWPEMRFAAVDVFLCGQSDAEAAATALERALKPARVERQTIPRGRAAQGNQASQPSR